MPTPRAPLRVFNISAVKHAIATGLSFPTTAMARVCEPLSGESMGFVPLVPVPQPAPMTNGSSCWRQTSVLCRDVAQLPKTRIGLQPAIAATGTMIP